MSDVTKMSAFEWNDTRSRAAIGLADGRTQQQVATECDITSRTIQRWLEHPEFAAEVDRLTLLTGIALRAERLRIVKRVIRQSVKDDQKIKTTKDILDWLKHAQSETNGTDLLEQLVASLTTS
jgi:Homeodomain-like domain-containing protein